jgi:O-antigen/teichoic acid export membrane protein
VTDVGKKALDALRWSAAARLVGQALSWMITIVVIRLLTPADYGLLAMAVILPTTLYLINDLGLDVVIVQNQTPDPAFLRQVFGVVIAINLVCALILLLGAPLVADFFNEPRVTPILRVLSLLFVLCVFETLPRARLEQRLDFRRQSMITVLATFLSGLLTLALAWMGAGVWALVWGRLCSSTITVVGVNLLAPSLCWPSFSLAAMKRSISFGGIVTLERAAWQVFNDADKVIGGKLWGDAMLGLYTVAQDLATMPMHRAGSFINAIGLPAFSNVQDRLHEVQFYLLKVTRIMSVMAFPLFVGLAVTAPEAVGLLLGPQWPGAPPILQILALIMPLRMLATLLPPVLWGISRPGVSAGNGWIAAVVVLGACLVGANWGAIGMALAWLAAYPVVFVITLHRAGKVLGLTLWDFGGAMLWPVVASALMAVAVTMARGVVPDEAAPGVALLILVPVGAATYVAALFALHRSSFRETLALVSR